MREQWRPGVALGCVAWLMWAAPSCQDVETRPGLVSDCNDPACIDGRGSSVGVPIGSGAAGEAGAAGAAGGGGMPDPSGGSLTGSVLEIDDQDLVMGRSLSVSGSVQVRAASALANADDVLVVPAADGSFTLDGIERGTTVWVGVGSFDDPPVEPFIDTLQAVDSTRMSTRDLLVVRRDVLRELAAESFLNNPIDLDPDGAHLLVQFVDYAGAELEGVQVTFPAPEDVSTAYDAGPIYSDALTQTSTRGVAVLLNLRAPAYPGTSLTLRATLDDRAVDAQVQIAQGAVTLVTAVVPD